MAVEENEAPVPQSRLQRRIEHLNRMTARYNRATEVANAISGVLYWPILVISLATVALCAVSLVVAPDLKSAVDLVVGAALALYSALSIVRGKRRKRERQSAAGA
jgi:Flp pilus assembly protein TadB